MRKMKDSGVEWIGMIPDNWEIKRMRNLFSLAFEKTNEERGDLLSLSQYTGIRYKSECDKSGMFNAESTIGYNVVHKGQFVMNIMLAWNGSYSVSKYDGIISPAYCVYDFTTECDKTYFDYLLSTDMFKGIFKVNSKGIIDSRLRLYPERFYPINVIFPPVAEQKTIADYLDRKCGEIDALVALQEEMIAELGAYKQQVISEAVTRGLNPDAPLKDSGIDWIGQIPQHWEVKRLTGLTTTGKGLPITKENLKLEGIAVVSYGQIHSKQNKVITLDDSLLRYVDPSYLETNKQCLLNQYDFVFADTSEDKEGAGNFVLNDKDTKVFGGYHTIILRLNPDQDINAKYMACFLDSVEFRSQIRSQVTGIKVYSITKSILKTTYVLIPPIHEQVAISEYLDRKCADIDRLIELKQQKIEELGAYKRSLIFECVTGKREVNQ